jgi:flagellar motility protein MotE (MotC chaperone)
MLLLCMLFVEKDGMLLSSTQAQNEVPIKQVTKKMESKTQVQNEANPQNEDQMINPLQTQKQLFKIPENAYLESEMLRQERESVERERHLLELEKQQLAALKNEIDEKIARLSEIQDTVQNKIGEQKALIEKYESIQQADIDKKFKHLLKIYTAMPSKKAAALIDKLDTEVGVKLLSKMKGEEVAQILGFIQPEKAADISVRLATP